MNHLSRTRPQTALSVRHRRRTPSLENTVSPSIGGAFSDLVNQASLGQQSAAQDEAVNVNIADIHVADVLPPTNLLYNLHETKRLSIPPKEVKRVIEVAVAALKKGVKDDAVSGELLELTGNKVSDLTVLGTALVGHSPESKPVAALLLSIASKRGDMDAEFYIANLLASGYAGQPPDMPGALALMKSLTDRDHPAALYILGLRILLDSKANAAEKVKGADLIRRGADVGYSGACAQMANLYDKGIVVAKDPVKAVHYMEKAHEQGVVESTFMLATRCASGEGLPDNKPDIERAFKLYRDAAAKGLSIAQHNLASYYMTGIPATPPSSFSLEASPRIAVEYFRMAAMQGLQLSQINLGKMYAEGFAIGGIKRDLRQARVWLEQCKKTGGPLGDEAGQMLEGLQEIPPEAPGQKGKCIIM
ncbi:hypothetical protein HK104_003911 [Borealophlyctis nickersoniae]|nr:hypothetical protein HK104_003911 [Borealophlyctis nickersoniae]